MLYLDTHVVVWLYEGRQDIFSDNSKRLINDHALVISPIVLLELKYLHEINRIKVEANTIFENLHNTIELRLCDSPFALVVSEAMLQAWTRDPFDRIIVAQAAVKNSPLLSKDQNILDNYAKAVW